MLSNLINRGSPQGIHFENDVQNAFEFFTSMVRYLVFSLLYQPEQLHRLAMIKRQISKAHRIQHYPSTPNIDLKRVVRFPDQHLRRSITWTTTSR